MINVVIVAVVLVLMAAGFVVTWQTGDRLRKKTRDAILWVLGPLLALLLVGLGVTLTLYLTEQQNKQANRELIRSGLQDVYQTRQGLIMKMSVLRSDDFPEEPVSDFFRRTGVPLPRFLFRVLDTERALMTLNDEMVESARSFENTSLSIARILENDSLSDIKADMLVEQYGVELWRLEEILTLFIQSLDEGWTLHEFDQAKQKILKQNLELQMDPDIRAGRRLHPWRQLGR